MPRDTLSRRAMLQMTTGAALAAPLALMPPGAVVADAAAPDRTPAPVIPTGPTRYLEGIVSIADRSEARSPFHRDASSKITIDIAADGRGALTLSHFDGPPDQVVAMPAEFARELDDALFYQETATDQRIREKREAGYVDCPMCGAA